MQTLSSRHRPVCAGESFWRTVDGSRNPEAQTSPEQPSVVPSVVTFRSAQFKEVKCTLFSTRGRHCTAEPGSDTDRSTQAAFGVHRRH